MDICIIIPTYNEAANIGRLISYLQQHTQTPILVADSPESTDGTSDLAKQAGVKVLTCPKGGRAPQMNYAAAHVRADVLYFVHADTLPPSNFETAISEAVSAGHHLGYFRYRFDSQRTLLRVNSYCTRFDGVFAGGGDQTLFIRESTFKQLGGFREELKLMEDFDLVKRARKAGYSHLLVQMDALVSARKYRSNSWLRVNLVNLWVFLLFRCGVSTVRLNEIYQNLLRPRV